jgi:putative oxidoreductase
VSRLLRLTDRAGALTQRWLDPLIPPLARLVFAGVLWGYFWTSAFTKLGAGPLGVLFPSAGAYVQIFPRAMEAAGYDPGRLGLWHWAVVVAGTWAEFLLPLLIVAGLATRLAALGMIGFIAVQSATDVVAHGAALGHWFDAASDALIADQRAHWLFLLIVLVARGGGALALDRLLPAPRSDA